MKKDLTIKKAAAALGVHQDTVKYWEEQKLIPPARRNPGNGYRIYNIAEIREIAKSRGICANELESALAMM
ncbi:MerR family DNA-binding transcriptional regulator (plasmid) [Paenibacillus rhizovicinus]|uniref:MerR family DNA-binding transcriptional regulator n=1 Tax=Paenibacillus rhizovicinus TaxID=2704463 RepID=A0A6C0PB31_9BACL|nr:MerR family DNA-binding transcriptional regulator [Paenibacillus rhizovicinus]QHW35747.1 MerR family DNA-binding transcriptional regulator [Paenibacillus rhizovicinus]